MQPCLTTCTNILCFSEDWGDASGAAASGVAAHGFGHRIFLEGQNPPIHILYNGIWLLWPVLFSYQLVLKEELKQNFRFLVGFFFFLRPGCRSCQKLSIKGFFPRSNLPKVRHSNVGNKLNKSLSFEETALSFLWIHSWPPSTFPDHDLAFLSACCCQGLLILILRHPCARCEVQDLSGSELRVMVC